MSEIEHGTSSETIKLIIDKALLESEARTKTTLSTTLSEQNTIYMAQIVQTAENVGKLTSRVDQLNERINGFKTLVVYVAAASVSLGGIVGFFISQLTQVGGK